MRLIGFLLLAIPLSAAADDTDLELQTSWGRVVLAAPEPPVALEPPIVELEARGPLPDVTRVLAFKPRVVERAPYVPGSRVGDHTATALIVTGGAAILTSIIVDWLRK